MWRRISPALVLVLLAPFIGEVLLGNTHSPIGYLFELPMYGGGALLVREVTRRTGRGWPTILLLGVAYGLVEEGLGDLTLWSPKWMGMRLLDYGHLGIGWPWWMHVLTLHAVFSIGVSVAVTEALFARRGSGPWLGRVGLTVTVVLFVLGTAGVNQAGLWGYTLRWWQVGVTVALTAVFVVAAFLVPRRRGAATDTAAVPGVLPVALLGLVPASVFLLVYRLTPGTLDVPAVVPIAVHVVLMAVVVALVGRWSRRAAWTGTHRFALAAGAALAYAWYGFLLTGYTPQYELGQALYALIGIGVLV
ncbi:MAG: hypothetical protein WCA46_10555, partial [Actinocatenispora sp.]